MRGLIASIIRAIRGRVTAKWDEHRSTGFCVADNQTIWSYKATCSVPNELFQPVLVRKLDTLTTIIFARENLIHNPTAQLIKLSILHQQFTYTKTDNFVNYIGRKATESIEGKDSTHGTCPNSLLKQKLPSPPFTLARCCHSQLRVLQSPVFGIWRSQTPGFKRRATNVSEMGCPSSTIMAQCVIKTPN